MTQKQEIINQINTIPSMPLTIVKLGNLLSDPATELEDIAKTIQYDPGFTANVLKLANSAQLGFPKLVGSLKEAVIRIGTHRIFQITVANSLKPLMDKSVPGYNLEDGDFWRHSVAVAVATEKVASMCPKIPADSFTAGLLHDVGKLVMAKFIEQKKNDFKEYDKKNLSFDAKEKKIIGVDHPEVGAVILENWKLPDALVDAVRNHHKPENSTINQVLVDQVHIADAICLSGGLGAGDDGLQYELSSDAVDRLNFNENKMEEVLCDTISEMKKFEKLMKAAK